MNNTLQLLDRLISFPTVSRDSNLDLINFVADYLGTRCAEVRLFKSPDGRKANLFATLGPRDRAGVLLSGHTDVVPVDGQQWSSDPFRLKEQGEALYGRGTADMKGFLACALTAADQASQRQLKRPLHLAFSYDEEIGCVGVRSLIQDMQTWAILPTLCIVGEPTLMKTAVGHKGKTALKVVCKGVAAHSALAPRGLNAIHLASDLVQGVRSLQTQLQSSGPREDGYDIPYSTVHVGRISGGTVLNIVPDHCELEVEIRNVATDPAPGLLAALRTEASRIATTTTRADATAEISVEITNEYPGLNTAEDSSVVEYVARLTQDPDRIRVAFGSEAGLFTSLGIPTVLCGPGSITQAHRPDEFVTKDQLTRCTTMMQGLIETLV